MSTVGEVVFFAILGSVRTTRFLDKLGMTDCMFSAVRHVALAPLPRAAFFWKSYSDNDMF